MQPTDVVISDDEADRQFIEQFKSEVDEQLSACGKLNMEKVAHSLRMGETQMKNRVQSIVGKPLAAFVTQLRMEKAMALLKQEDPRLLIGDIAEQCGYLDVAYFSRVFRQHYGITPTQARTTGM